MDPKQEPSSEPPEPESDRPDSGDDDDEEGADDDLGKCLKALSNGKLTVKAALKEVDGCEPTTARVDEYIRQIF